MEKENMEVLAQTVLGKIFVPLEASGRHVHVTKEQAQILFGHSLTPDRELSQPGQYLSKERVTVVGTKGKFENVAVLGPERKAAQVEIGFLDRFTGSVVIAGDVDSVETALTAVTQTLHDLIYDEGDITP